MAVKGFHCVLGYMTMEEHRKCAVGAAPCGYPASLLQMMEHPVHERQRERVQFSPSSILGCNRQQALQQSNDWYINPDDQYSAARGTLLHHGFLEEGAPAGAWGAIRELRLHAPLQTKHGQQRFSGQIDEILLLYSEVVNGKMVMHTSISDWKTKNDIGHDMLEADDRHTRQVNMYSWLVTQALTPYLNDWSLAPPEARLALNVPLVPIDSVVVDELNLVYLSQTKVRRFVSGQFRHARGKYIQVLGTDKKMHRTTEQEDLELVPLHEFSLENVQAMIRQGIEEQIDGQTVLALPLEADAAKKVCPYCHVRDTCISLGKAQGINMVFQERRFW